MHDHEEPRVDLLLAGTRLTLLGTAHVSRKSAETVRDLIATGDFDAVAVELCASRHTALMDPESLARLDIFAVVRSGRAPMVLASLALSAYQQRLAEQLDIEPGAEQRMAVREATARGLPVWLVDREIGLTLGRVGANLGWLARAELIAGLAVALLSREEVSAEEIERLKEGDMLETAFAELARDRQRLYVPLIDERDRYIAARLRQEVAADGRRAVLVVLGAGHLAGVARYLAADSGEGDPAATLVELTRVPPPGMLKRALPWALMILIVIGFAYGFAQSPGLGWELLADWALITGVLAAIGTLAAAAHPLTVLAALVAAPITTLLPVLSIGMVTAPVELYLRRPSVGDFARLRQDTTRLGGWWHNRVARTLLVFVLSTLGAATGTYLAGYRLAERLWA